MSSDESEQKALLTAIESLRAEVARLNGRVSALEASTSRPAARTESSSNSSGARGEPIADETLLFVITAAVAAYLGVQPRIRQIRLIGGMSWGLQGRVTIQASHALAVRHG